MSFKDDDYEILLYFKLSYIVSKLDLQNDYYAHKIKKIMCFKEDDYEILLYLNFHILLVDKLIS